MGFIDKMCYNVSKEIVNDIFWKKYEKTIKENKTWYENLNSFIVNEWLRLKDINEKSQFTEDEEEMIVQNAMELILEKLDIDDDDFEENEQEVDWGRYDEIILHYMCNI